MIPSRFVAIPGFLVTAFLLLGAVAAPTVSALEFHSEQKQTMLTTTALSDQVFAGPYIAALNIDEFACPGVQIEETLEVETVEELSLVPSFLECAAENEAKAVYKASVDMNTCSFFLAPTEKLETNKYAGSAGIECELPEDTIILRYTALGFPCVQVYPQSPEGNSVYFTNEGSGVERSIRVEWALAELEYFNHCVSPLGVRNDLSLTGEFTLAGESEEEDVGVWIE
jgi:hypothetical protein